MATVTVRDSEATIAARDALFAELDLLYGPSSGISAGHSRLTNLALRLRDSHRADEARALHPPMYGPEHLVNTMPRG